MSDYKEVIKLDDPITLRPMPNGGWIVEQPSMSPGLMGQYIGAYSNTPDLLDMLNHMLGNRAND